MVWAPDSPDLWAPDSGRPDLWAPDSNGHLTLGGTVDLFLGAKVGGGRLAADDRVVPDDNHRVHDAEAHRDRLLRNRIVDDRATDRLPGAARRRGRRGDLSPQCDDSTPRSAGRPTSKLAYRPDMEILR